MRISDSTIVGYIRSDLSAANQRMVRMQEQLASGNRINQPSDDPTATGTLLRLESEIADDAQVDRTANTAHARLSAADTALASVDSLLQSAQQLGEQAQNGALSAGDRQSIVTQLNNLLQEAIQDGNTSFEGQYLFAGAKTTAAPFSTSGAMPATVAYNGDDTPLTLPLQQGSSVRLDVPGDQTLGPAFSAIIALRDAVNAGDTGGTATALSSVGDALSVVDQARGDIGARENAVSAAQTAADSLSTSLQAQKSALGDTDIADTAVQFNAAQTAYQATLAAAGRLLQTSLLDFLR